MEVRGVPCTSCPYRTDVPSGIWAWEEYEKLREYDAPTAQQPMNVFACHATPDHYCHGWAVVHMNRGPDPNDPSSQHPYDLIALRISHGMGRWSGEMPPVTVPLFPSGTAAADHGQRDITNPNDKAIETSERLLRKYPRLTRGDTDG